jgi:hypothetical protein
MLIAKLLYSFADLIVAVANGACEDFLSLGLILRRSSMYNAVNSGEWDGPSRGSQSISDHYGGLGSDSACRKSRAEFTTHDRFRRSESVTSTLT